MTEQTFNPFSLSGKTILVTGASSGIGRGIAIACSKMGARIVACGRNAERLQETIEALSDHDDIALVADLTDSDNVNRMVAGMPAVDGIVHCAGIGFRKLTRFLEQEEVEQVIKTNFNAPILLQSEIIKQKRINRNGSIVFISSMAIDSPSIGNGLYSASKAALDSYAKCLALELAPRKIRVNSICPAMIWTKLILEEGLTEEELKEDEKTYPLKRYGTPEDVANLAIYMLSDASSWMTGESVKITGGAR